MKFIIKVPVSEIREFDVVAKNEDEAKKKVHKAIIDSKAKCIPYDDCDEDVSMSSAEAILFKEGEEDSWIIEEK